MTALDPGLLKILACPACKTPVEYRPETSELSCAKCGRRYPVVDGIPDMLMEKGA